MQKTMGKSIFIGHGWTKLGSPHHPTQYAWFIGGDPIHCRPPKSKHPAPLCGKIYIVKVRFGTLFSGCCGYIGFAVRVVFFRVSEFPDHFSSFFDGILGQQIAPLRDNPIYPNIFAASRQKKNTNFTTCFCFGGTPIFSPKPNMLGGTPISPNTQYFQKSVRPTM